jgi:CubicO group peptidase (beta-lactamase class C family)
MCKLKFRVVTIWLAITALLAKAIVGSLSLAVAMTDEKIALDDPASKHIPEWRNDPRKAKIPILHPGSHTSGIEDAEADRLPHEQLAFDLGRR